MTPLYDSKQKTTFMVGALMCLSFLFLFSIPVATALTWNIDHTTVISNSTEFWITSLGSLGDANTTQFQDGAFTLSINESWLDSFGDNLWCELNGCTMQGDINMDFKNILDVGNATITQKLFIGSSNHFLKKGAEGFNGISTEAFSFQHSEEHLEGTITFIVTANKSNSDIDAVNIMSQIGRNNSGGYLGNSWMVAPNNLTTNLTDLSNCLFVINATGNIPRMFCDTSDSGADFFVQDSIQTGGIVFAGGGIRAETEVDFVMHGEDVNIQGGGLHILTPVNFTAGVIQGNEVITFAEDFIGDLGSFINLQSDLGNWFATSSILCDDGDCANALGISGVGNIIMEANISTVNINSTSLNFVYSLSNMLGANDFEVIVNNNVGSGDVVLLTDSTNSVIKSAQSISMPSSMSNQPSVSIRFNCDVTNTNRQCFVDTVNVNGTAINTTLTNQSGFDSVIIFGDGSLAPDGFPERGIFYNASEDKIIIRGHTAMEDLVEQDLNVTNSITLNLTTIFDWAGVVNSPSFPGYFLLNGTSVMQGNANIGGFNLTNTDYGFFNFLGSLLNPITKLWVTDINVSNNVVIRKNLSVGNSTLFVDSSSDRLGIGTDAPDTKLDINGEIQITNPSTGAGHRIGVDTNANPQLTFQSQVAGTGPAFGFYSKDGDGTDFVSWILYGMGTPGSIANRERLLVQYAVTAFKISTEAQGTGILRPLIIETEGNPNQVYLKTNGNVGISTNNPNMKLDVAVGAASSSGIRVVGSNGPQIRLTNTATNGEDFRFTSFTDGKLYIFDSVGGNRMVLNSANGNLGIATSFPQAKLHVVGTTRLGDQATNYFSVDGRGSISQTGSGTAQLNNLTVIGNITVEDRFFLGNGASIGYNATCQMIFYNSTGGVMSSLGCA